jgi:SAM-dependent methyltransferase
MEALPHQSWANWYDFVYENTYGKIYKQLGQAQLELIEQHVFPESHIIDYGAGTGRLSIPLALKGYKITAVERSEGMANQLQFKAKEAAVSIELSRNEISAHKGKSATCALAVFTVLTYITEANNMASCLKAISKHLDRDGLFLFDLPSLQFFEEGELFHLQTSELNRRVHMANMGNDIFLYSDIGNGIFNGQSFEYSDEFHIRYWRIDDLIDLLKDSDLEQVNIPLDELNFSGANYYLFRKTSD